VPPARIPDEDGERLDELPTNQETIRDALLDAFDRQQQVDLAARLVARHLTLRPFATGVDRDGLARSFPKTGPSTPYQMPEAVTQFAPLGRRG
jgi:hypothetical protein